MSEYIKAYLQSLHHTFEECDASNADLEKMHAKLVDMIRQYNMMNNEVHHRLEICKRLASNISEEAALAGESEAASEAEEIYNLTGKMWNQLPRNAYVGGEDI
jgi:uncharacterized coiled-coil DUF342 family protein